jgi:hypothetical protein
VKDPKTGGPDVSAALKELPRFLTLEARALEALGLERRMKPALTLADYLLEREAASAPTAHEPGNAAACASVAAIAPGRPSSDAA